MKKTVSENYIFVTCLYLLLLWFSIAINFGIKWIKCDHCSLMRDFFCDQVTTTTEKNNP